MSEVKIIKELPRNAYRVDGVPESACALDHQINGLGGDNEWNMFVRRKFPIFRSQDLLAPEAQTHSRLDKSKEPSSVSLGVSCAIVTNDRCFR